MVRHQEKQNPTAAQGQGSHSTPSAEAHIPWGNAATAGITHCQGNASLPLKVTKGQEINGPAPPLPAGFYALLLEMLHQNKTQLNWLLNN